MRAELCTQGVVLKLMSYYHHHYYYYYCYYLVRDTTT